MTNRQQSELNRHERVQAPNIVVGHQHHPSTYYSITVNSNLGTGNRLESDDRHINDNNHNDEYIIDKIVGHKINEDDDHPSTDVGETTYRVR